MIMLKKKGRLLRKYESVLLIMCILGIPFAATETFALRWKAWHYHSQNILNIQLGAQIETYLVGLGVFMAVASATLIAITQTDRSIARNEKRMIKSSSKKKTSKLRIRYAHAK